MSKGIPIHIDDRVIPPFHPVHQRDSAAWYPANEAASLLVHIDHIWDDILVLSQMRRKARDERDKRLLLKYIIVGRCTPFLGQVCPLGIVMSRPWLQAGNVQNR